MFRCARVYDARYNVNEAASSGHLARRREQNNERGNRNQAARKKTRKCEKRSGWSCRPVNYKTFLSPRVIATFRNPANLALLPPSWRTHYSSRR